MAIDGQKRAGDATRITTGIAAIRANAAYVRSTEAGRLSATCSWRRREVCALMPAT